MPNQEADVITQSTTVNNPDIKDDADFISSLGEAEVEVEEKPKVKSPVEKTEKTEEVEEAEEEKQEEEEQKESEEEETPEFLVSRPTWAQINKEFPDFFKKFPDMRHVIGREMEYSKVFPTVEEAKEAAESSQDYEFLENTFKTGSAKEVLDLMKESDEGAYQKFAVDFLPSLYNADKDQYFNIVGPVVHNLLNNVYSSFKDKQGDEYENLRNAALVLSEYWFQDANAVTKPAQAPKAEVKAENNQENQFLQTRLKEARDSVATDTLTELQDMLFDECVKQFPDGKVPKAFQDIVEDIVESGVNKINKSMTADEAYMNSMKWLWKKAYSSGFTGDWKERITKAYLSRAKELIPGITRKLDALVPRKERETHEKKIPNASVHKNNSGSVPSSKEIDWSNTSDRDFLEGDIKTKS